MDKRQGRTYLLKNFFQVSKNFEKYCEPINRDLIKINDVSALWRHIAPHLKSSLNTVYLGTGVR